MMNNTKTNHTYVTGLLGEIWVAIIYFFRGYRVIKWRYKCKTGEIDLFLKRGKLLVFCEVKTRLNRNNTYNNVYNIVTPKQMQRVRNSAMSVVSKNIKYHNCQYRIDIAYVYSFFTLPVIFDNVTHI